MRPGQIALLILVGLLAVAAASSIFYVRETEHAIKFRFGEILKSDYQPGIHFKWPVVNSVRKFDRRILTLDTRPETFPTEEQKYVEVDFYAKWRIADPALFYKSVNNINIGAERLLQVLKDGIKNEVASRTLQEVVSAERAEIMGAITEKADEAASQLGMKLVDVRIKQIELPRGISEDVYKRMRSEREEVATRIRAEGAEKAEEIRAEADRKKTVILANAFKQAEEIRGAGDARAAQIYADAYGKDPAFFEFYRSLQAYSRSLEGKRDVIVLDADSEFFQYFNQASGR